MVENTMSMGKKLGLKQNCTVKIEGVFHLKKKIDCLPFEKHFWLFSNWHGELDWHGILSCSFEIYNSIAINITKQVWLSCQCFNNASILFCGR